MVSHPRRIPDSRTNMSTDSKASDHNHTTPSLSKTDPTLLGMPHEIRLKILRLVIPAAVLEIPGHKVQWHGVRTCYRADDSDRTLKYSPSLTVKRPKGSEAILLTCGELFEMGIKVAYEELTLVTPLLLNGSLAGMTAWCDSIPVKLRKRITKVGLKPDAFMAHQFRNQGHPAFRSQVNIINLSVLSSLKEVEVFYIGQSAADRFLRINNSFDEQRIRDEIVRCVLCGPMEGFLDSLKCRSGIKLSGKITLVGVARDPDQKVRFEPVDVHRVTNLDSLPLSTSRPTISSGTRWRSERQTSVEETWRPLGSPPAVGARDNGSTLDNAIWVRVTARAGSGQVSSISSSSYHHVCSYR